MSESFETFTRLHAGPDVLLLANCWDAGSARVIERLGARALATTSAGVAWSHGFPDGDALPLDILVTTVRAIRRVTRLPLSVDIEGGCGAEPATVAEAVMRVASEGAVGINIEDGAGTPDLLAEKISAVKRAGSRRGIDVFVNARTDVYLRGIGPAGARLDETLRRAARYRDAGADGLFVPGLTERKDLEAVAREAKMPLNVLARPGLPPAAELATLGVRRLSAGSSIAQAASGRTAALARAFLAEGRSEPLAEGATAYAELNAMFREP